MIDDQENSAQRDSLTPPPDNTIFVSPGSPMRLSYRVEEIRTDYFGTEPKGADRGEDGKEVGQS